jgi:hypothetical protein
LVITSLTSGGCSVGIVRSLTKGTDLDSQLVREYAQASSVLRAYGFISGPLRVRFSCGRIGILWFVCRAHPLTEETSKLIATTKGKATVLNLSSGLRESTS